MSFESIVGGLLKHYSWRTFFSLALTSGIFLLLSGRLGLAEFVKPFHGYVWACFIFSTAMTLTYAATSLHKLREGSRAGKIYFVRDVHNTGWAYQGSRSYYRLAGAFSYDGVHRVVILNMRIKGFPLPAAMSGHVRGGDGTMMSAGELHLVGGDIPTDAIFGFYTNGHLGASGKVVRKTVLLQDQFRREFSIGKVELPFLGQLPKT